MSINNFGYIANATKFSTEFNNIVLCFT